MRLATSDDGRFCAPLRVVVIRGSARRAGGEWPAASSSHRDRWRPFDPSHPAGLLDWYHVSEHVHAAAKIVAPSDAQGWARAALDQLWNQGGESLVAGLESQLKGRRGQSRSAIEGLRNYLIGQRNHLEFRQSRARGWPIGTGRMESSCKQLVGVRLKGPGMHWTEHGALAMTALKATDLNGHWHAFWNTLTLAT